MPKPPPDGDDEARAFQEAVRGARRLDKGVRRVTGPAAPSRRAGGRTGATPTPPPFEVEALGDACWGRAADVSAAILRALRRGEPRPEARLDLHGQPRDEALRATATFLGRARHEGRRVVLVIHGRGQNSDAGIPVLRPALHAWLGSAAAARAGVMAFASAPVREGGTGATIILLRR